MARTLLHVVHLLNEVRQRQSRDAGPWAATLVLTANASTNTNQHPVIRVNIPENFCSNLWTLGSITN